MNTPYTEANNIYTCVRGHSYSFHTEAALSLKKEGICEECEKEGVVYKVTEPVYVGRASDLTGNPPITCPICGATECLHMVNTKKFECRSPACGNLHDDVDDVLCRECRPDDQCSEAGIQFVEVDHHGEACLELTIDYKKGHIFLSEEFWGAIGERAWPALVKDLPRDKQLELELVRKIEKVEKTRPSDVVLSARVTKLEGLLNDAVSRGEALANDLRELRSDDAIQIIKNLRDEIASLKVEKEDYYARAKQAECLVDVDLTRQVNTLQQEYNELNRTHDTLVEDNKRVLKDSNEAMRNLWAFIDAVADVPRHGNLFARAREVLPRARKLLDISGYFQQLWDLGEGPLSIEEYGENYGRALVGVTEENMVRGKLQEAQLDKLRAWLMLEEGVRPDDIVQRAINRIENGRSRLQTAKDNHRLDALDILSKLENDEILPHEGMSNARLIWVRAKLKDIANGKGRGGIQS